MDSNYFVVDNKYQAMGIQYATNEKFYKFTNNEGREIYSFPKTEQVQQVYRLLKDLHYKNK